MSTITITRRLEIDAGHRLLKHEGKCRNYHGHRYIFEITVRARELDDVGRVIDFSEVKRLVGGWLDENWDHGMILQQGDPLIPLLQELKLKHAVYVTSPTAENLTEHLFNVACNLGLFDQGIQIVGVRCFETPNCSAEYAPLR